VLGPDAVGDLIVQPSRRRNAQRFDAIAGIFSGLVDGVPHCSLGKIPICCACAQDIDGKLCV